MMRKVLDINHGRHIICIKIDKPGEPNPFRLCRVEWYGGRYHRRQIAKYADFHSVLWYISQNQEWFTKGGD